MRHSGLQPLPVHDRARSVKRALADYIGRTNLSPGDRLPTERELTAGLAVGRSTVREALRELQAMGIIESRRGSGAYLRRRVSADAIHLPLTIDAASLRERLLHTLDVRRGLEIEASSLAAQRRTARDLKTIRAKLETMERIHLSEGAAGREDLAFHLAVYDAAHNPLFRQLLEQIRGAFESFFDAPFGRLDFSGRSFPFHRRLYEAIERRSPVEARDCTLAILAITEEDIREMSR